jgi:hypothetical protein
VLAATVIATTSVDAAPTSSSYYDEAPPDRGASLSQERQRGSLRDIDIASSDRLLKKALDDPLICNERF